MSRLMNEEVMTRILSNLSVEELLKLERVSQQFKYCANEVLKRQKGLSIGKIDSESECECFRKDSKSQFKRKSKKFEVNPQKVQ